MAEKSKDITFAPGGIVKFVSLISKPELNGRLGAIRKISNGKFQIMPTFGKNDLCVKKANLEKLDKTDSLLGRAPHSVGTNTNKWYQNWYHLKAEIFVFEIKSIRTTRYQIPNRSELPGPIRKKNSLKFPPK